MWATIFLTKTLRQESLLNGSSRAVCYINKKLSSSSDNESSCTHTSIFIIDIMLELSPGTTITVISG